LPKPFQVTNFPYLWDEVLADALFIHDHDGRFLEVNRKACESLGYTRPELLTMNVTDLELDFDLGAAREVWSRVKPGVTEVAHGRQRRKDGTVFPVEVHFGLLEESGQRIYFGSVRDISDRFRAESVLRDRAAQLRGAFEAMAEGLVLQTLDGKIIDANPAAEVILGLTRDQLLGKSSPDPGWEAIREDESPFPGSEHPAMVTARTGEAVRSQIMGVRDPKTGLRWISINAQPVLATDGNALSGVICTFTDVTEQRRLTEQLRVARADLQAVLDNVPARISSWLPDYTNRFANQVAAAQFGVESDACVGKHMREILGEERFRRAKPFIDAALVRKTQSHERIDPQPDGSNRYSMVTYVPDVRKGVVVGVYVFATDITELRSFRERIRNLARRLEIVREDEHKRVSRILHERIAQDLFAMKLWIKQLATESKIDLANSEIDQAIASAIDHSIEVVRDLANDLRPDMLAHLPLTAGLNAYARQFSHLSGLQIRVIEKTPKPKIDEETRLAFFRAAQELLSNVSRHAQASSVEISLRHDDPRLVMEVSDDGIGIDPASVNKDGAFGLLGIQERFGALGGTFQIQRNEGLGTTVSMSIPIKRSELG
jgi:PAS domain S-box-containing protein